MSGGKQWPCRICRRHEYDTREALVGHLTHHHSRQAVAVEYLAALEREAAAQRAVSRALDQAPRCGKVRFPSEEKATEALVQAWRSRSPKRRELRVYQCQRCDGGWHLTSRPGDDSDAVEVAS